MHFSLEKYLSSLLLIFGLIPLVFCCCAIRILFTFWTLIYDIYCLYVLLFYKNTFYILDISIWHTLLHLPIRGPVISCPASVFWYTEVVYFDLVYSRFRFSPLFSVLLLSYPRSHCQAWRHRDFPRCVLSGVLGFMPGAHLPSPEEKQAVYIYKWDIRTPEDDHGWDGNRSNVMERDPMGTMWRELQWEQSVSFVTSSTQTWRLGKEWVKRKTKI